MVPFKLLMLIVVTMSQLQKVHCRHLRERTNGNRSPIEYRCAPSNNFAMKMNEDQCKDVSRLCFDHEANEPIYCKEKGMRCRPSNCDPLPFLSTKTIDSQTHAYRCINSDHDINNFNCASTKENDCANAEGTGADPMKCAKCMKVTCTDSVTALDEAADFLGTVDYYRSRGYVELDYIPHMCISKTQPFDCHTAKMCHDDGDKTKPLVQRCAHPSVEECKPMTQCINYNLTNKKVSILPVTPGLFPVQQIRGGHDPIVFFPWKCVPSNETPSSDRCGTYTDCYDNSQPESKNSRKCPLGTFCQLLDQQCPSKVMHREQNQDHYGDGFDFWDPNVRHGNSGPFNGRTP